MQQKQRIFVWRGRREGECVHGAMGCVEFGWVEAGHWVGLGWAGWILKEALGGLDFTPPQTSVVPDLYRPNPLLLLLHAICAWCLHQSCSLLQIGLYLQGWSIMEATKKMKRVLYSPVLLNQDERACGCRRYCGPFFRCESKEGGRDSGAKNRGGSLFSTETAPDAATATVAAAAAAQLTSALM